MRSNSSFGVFAGTFGFFDWLLREGRDTERAMAEWAHAAGWSTLSLGDVPAAASETIDRAATPSETSHRAA